MCSAPKPKPPPPPAAPAEPAPLELESKRRKRQKAEPESLGRRGLRIDLNFNPGGQSGLRIPTSG